MAGSYQIWFAGDGGYLKALNVDTGVETVSFSMSGMTYPAVGCVDTDLNVYVVESNTSAPSKVVKVSPQGTILATWTIAGITRVRTIARNPSDGNFYLHSMDQSKLVKISSQGTVLASYETGISGGGYPVQVAVDGNGNIWCAGGGKVVRMSSAGAQLTTYGFGPSGQWYPGVSVDPATGHVWITSGFSEAPPQNRSLWKFDSADGSGLATYSLQDPTGNVAFDASGNVWMTNGAADGKLIKLNPSGVPQATYAIGSVPVGVFRDVDGNLWAVNRASSQVTKITSNGTYLGTYSTGYLPNVFVDPTGWFGDSLAPQFTIQLQYDTGAGYQDVTTQAGAVGSNQTIGAGQVGYWRTPGVDKPDIESTTTVKLLATQPDSEFGYFAGGYTGNAVSVATTDKLNFSTYTTAAQASANLSQVRRHPMGCNGGSTKGYWGGGDSAWTTFYQTTDKVTFSTEVTVAVGTAALQNVARSAGPGLSQGSTHGYFGGGITNGTGAVCVVNTDKITFVTDSTAYQSSANLSVTRYGIAAISGVTDGYAAGGRNNPNQLTTTDRIQFSSDVRTAVTTADLTIGRMLLSGCRGNSTKGYFAGGDTNSGYNSGYVTTAEILMFSTEATSAQGSAALSPARCGLGATSDATASAYFVGGSTSAITGVVTTADRVVVATDTRQAQVTANLSQARGGVEGLATVAE